MIFQNLTHTTLYDRESDTSQQVFDPMDCIVFPTKTQTAFFTPTKSADLSPFSVYAILRAWEHLNFVLYTAKLSVSTRHILQDATFANKNRATFNDAFAQFLETQTENSKPLQQVKWVKKLCDKTFRTELALPALLFEEKNYPSALSSCELAHLYQEFAERLTAELGNILYTMPEKRIKKRLALNESEYEAFITPVYLYLDWALSDFKAKLISCEAPECIAQPFALLVRESENEEDETTSNEDFEDCILCPTAYIPTLTTYHIYHAPSGTFQNLLWDHDEGSFLSFPFSMGGNPFAEDDEAEGDDSDFETLLSDEALEYALTMTAEDLANLQEPESQENESVEFDFSDFCNEDFD